MPAHITPTEKRTARHNRATEKIFSRLALTAELGLTAREVDVLQLIAEGNANKMMAHILKLSIKTVEKHRQSVMNRLNIHDTASLTRYAVQIGLIDCRPQKVMANILAET